jgi:non-specific serine/threonine protein kinase/serine/threonine-protein kinase
MPDDESTLTSFEDPGGANRIGPYRLLQKIGEGGMGEVWEAEQQEPVRRVVALKLIKWGMDTKQVVARFESERQALALMDHAGIAKVFDAGATETGRPYFVMEHVKGVPITKYCDTHRLTTGERLKLFMEVCDAVQHAHQKGIIHRDIKASNVLVSVQDAEPVPKIIDFGVAKATAQKLTEKTVFTEYGALIGTPEYMSPEQAEMTGLDVDTRTDVYSLGVLLYELLTGVLPFDSEELREAGFDEIRRKIREEEPSRPSTRISTLAGEKATSVSTAHRAELPALSRLLKGDLDWITMKALEKDRTRRYQSPTDLAADIERHLTHQPVVASPPSTAYRMRKFIRRHKVGVAAGAIVVAALILGITGATVGLVRARKAETLARQEAETAEQVSDFLVGLFEVSDPGEARGNTITAREILDRGAEKIERELADQPLVRARMAITIGKVYRQLGLYGRAVPLLLEAVETRERGLGDDHPETLRAANVLAVLYDDQGRYEEAERLYLENLEKQKRVLGGDDLETLRSMNNLAVLYRSQRRYDEAEALYLETVDSQRRVLGDDHPETLRSMNNLANLYVRQGRNDDAEPLYLEAISSQERVLGEQDPETLRSMNNLAVLYMNLGRYEEGEALCLETLENRKRVLGDDHPETLSTTNNLAILYKDQGRYEEAEPLALKTVETRRRVLGDDHPRTLQSTNNLARLYVQQGRFEEAEALTLESLERLRSVLGEHHPETLRSMDILAVVYLSRDEAEPRDSKSAMEFARVVNEQTGFERPNYLKTLALAYYRTGDRAKAIEIQNKALDLLPDDSPARAEFGERLSKFESASNVRAE